MNPGSFEEFALFLVHLGLAALRPVLSNIFKTQNSDSFYETKSDSPLSISAPLLSALCYKMFHESLKPAKRPSTVRTVDRDALGESRETAEADGSPVGSGEQGKVLDHHLPH